MNNFLCACLQSLKKCQVAMKNLKEKGRTMAGTRKAKNSLSASQEVGERIVKGVVEVESSKFVVRDGMVQDLGDTFGILC